MGRLTGLLGLATMLGLAFLFSSNRQAIRLKTVLLGLFLQIVFAIFVLRFDFGRYLLEFAGHGVDKFLEYSFAGSQLVFGDLGKKGSQFGMIFAFQVLPIIIFIAIVEGCQSDLAQIIQALHGDRLLTGSIEGGQQQARQNCDHRDDHQKFNEREGGTRARGEHESPRGNGTGTDKRFETSGGAR